MQSSPRVLTWVLESTSTQKQREREADLFTAVQLLPESVVVGLAGVSLAGVQLHTNIYGLHIPRGRERDSPISHGTAVPGSHFHFPKRRKWEMDYASPLCAIFDLAFPSPHHGKWRLRLAALRNFRSSVPLSAPPSYLAS